MEPEAGAVICKCCKHPALTGKYCPECGQALAVKKITFGSLVHEMFHFFTHVDKGFPFTLRRLITHPGIMQREYLEGQRVRHQKPFSMFLISATIIALALYWINIILSTYFEAGDLREAVFFDKYMVMLLLFMAPLLSLIVFMTFYSSEYNYWEILVFSLYTISVFFLIVILANLLKLIWPTMETRYVEIPSILIYNAVTFKNFFNRGRTWWVITKSVFCSFTTYAIIAKAQDFLVDRFTN